MVTKKRAPGQKPCGRRFWFYEKYLVECHRMSDHMGSHHDQVEDIFWDDGDPEYAPETSTYKRSWNRR